MKLKPPNNSIYSQQQDSSEIINLLFIDIFKIINFYEMLTLQELKTTHCNNNNKPGDQIGLPTLGDFKYPLEITSINPSISDIISKYIIRIRKTKTNQKIDLINTKLISDIISYYDKIKNNNVGNNNELKEEIDNFINQKGKLEKLTKTQFLQDLINDTLITDILESKDDIPIDCTDKTKKIIKKSYIIPENLKYITILINKFNFYMIPNYTIIKSNILININDNIRILGKKAKLESIINHHGDTNNSGHYTYINFNNSLQYNDSIITDPNPIDMSDSYLIVYRLLGDDNNENRNNGSSSIISNLSNRISEGEEEEEGEGEANSAAAAQRQKEANNVARRQKNAATRIQKTFKDFKTKQNYIKSSLKQKFNNLNAHNKQTAIKRGWDSKKNNNSYKQYTKYGNSKSYTRNQRTKNSRKRETILKDIYTLGNKLTATKKGGKNKKQTNKRSTHRAHKK
jgi:hypothetical protein